MSLKCNKGHILFFIGEHMEKARMPYLDWLQHRFSSTYRAEWVPSTWTYTCAKFLVLSKAWTIDQNLGFSTAGLRIKTELIYSPLLLKPAIFTKRLHFSFMLFHIILSRNFKSVLLLDNTSTSLNCPSSNLCCFSNAFSWILLKLWREYPSVCWLSLINSSLVFIYVNT